MNNPVIGLTKEVISVIPIILAFFCSMSILMTIYLNVPKGISSTFVNHAFNIINGLP